MADRGPHGADASLFSAQQAGVLQQAVRHLSWLLSHGYAAPSSLKLVGDRFQLVSRQRTAVMRSACSDTAVENRHRRLLAPADLADRDLEIDTFNLLITLEAALSGGVVLGCRDGTYRDMASMHGSYRRGSQTQRAIQLLGQFLHEHQIGDVLFRVDRPVSNSGRLKQWLVHHAASKDYRWQVSLDDDPDPLLGTRHAIVATADAAVLDRVDLWINLAREIIATRIPQAWVVGMSE